MTAATHATQTAYRPRKKFPWGRTIAWIAMALLLFVTIFPFYWMLRTALTSPKAIFLDTGSLLPVQPTLLNFARVLGLIDPATAVSVTFAAAILALAMAAFVAGFVVVLAVFTWSAFVPHPAVSDAYLIPVAAPVVVAE